MRRWRGLRRSILVSSTDQACMIVLMIAVVACRTPFIGVAGSIIAGGFSWLSGDYGCTSDPNNMLDAQFVKLDGSVVWASKEPDLLWGLRGAQLGLGGNKNPDSRPTHRLTTPFQSSRSSNSSPGNTPNTSGAARSSSQKPKPTNKPLPAASQAWTRANPSQKSPCSSTPSQAC